MEENKDVIQLLATPEKVESRPLERWVVEESSTSSESSEEKGELDHERKPDLVQRSSR